MSRCQRPVVSTREPGRSGSSRVDEARPGTCRRTARPTGRATLSVLPDRVDAGDDELRRRRRIARARSRAGVPSAGSSTIGGPLPSTAVSVPTARRPRARDRRRGDRRRRRWSTSVAAVARRRGRRVAVVVVGASEWPDPEQAAATSASPSASAAGRDDPSPTLPAVTTRHPLQPKDWKSGSHAERFERVRALPRGPDRARRRRRFGDRPARLDARGRWPRSRARRSASSSTTKLAARARERGYDVRRRRRRDARPRPHVRGGVGGGAHRAPVVRGRLPRRRPPSSRARVAASCSPRPTRSRSPTSCTASAVGPASTGATPAGTTRRRSRSSCTRHGYEVVEVSYPRASHARACATRCSPAPSERCCRTILPRTPCWWSPRPTRDRRPRQNLRLTGVITRVRLRRGRDGARGLRW